MDKSETGKQLARKYCIAYAKAAEAVRCGGRTAHLWEAVRAAEAAAETAQDAQRRTTTSA